MDTEGLDEVTAEAVQLLLAADLVAAEQYASGQHGNHGQRHLFDPAYVTLIIAMVCLVLIAFGQLRLLRQSQEAADQRDKLSVVIEENKHITEQIASCVEPTGECSRRAIANQALAIKVIVNQQAINICRAVFIGNPVQVQGCFKSLGVTGDSTNK